MVTFKNYLTSLNLLVSSAHVFLKQAVYSVIIICCKKSRAVPGFGKFIKQINVVSVGVTIATCNLNYCNIVTFQ